MYSAIVYSEKLNQIHFKEPSDGEPCCLAIVKKISFSPRTLFFYIMGPKPHTSV